MIQRGISESRFHMWRAVFALSHADHVVTEEEQRFMSDVLVRERFSEEQKVVLQEDMKVPRDIPDLFVGIEEQEDRIRFFYFARLLLWCDGDFAAQEEKILTELQRLQVRTVNLQEVSASGLHLENDEKEWLLGDEAGNVDESPHGSVWGRIMRRLKS